MSEIVDRWVERLKGRLPSIGEMTHWERLEAAFQRKPTDFVPVAPELDYWQITYAGYTFGDIFNDVDKTTDACLKTWADLRTDAIWMYVDIAHQLESFLPPEKRAENFVIRGPKDYVLFKPLAKTLDDAIGLYESKPWEKYGASSRAATHYTPHMLQLLEFQEKMDRQVPVIVGCASPINYAETVVEVQQFVKWMITEPKAKMHHFLDLCLQERLGAIDFYRDFAHKNGCRFFCVWGGARTWGPKQIREFIGVDDVFFQKLAKVFPHILWHHCGHNLDESLVWFTKLDGLEAVQYDMSYYFSPMTWKEWCGHAAEIFAGRICAANAPTTQLCCHGKPEEIDAAVKEFIEATLPHTSAVVMPGCEVDSYAPVENVKAMVDAARKYGRNPRPGK